jgi:hypothetical protein
MNQSEPSEHQPVPLTWVQAREKVGFRIEKEFELPKTIKKPSDDWQLVHTVHRIERFKQKELSSNELHSDEGGKLIERQAALRDGKANLAANSELNFFKSAKIEAFWSEELPYRVGLNV